MNSLKSLLFSTDFPPIHICSPVLVATIGTSSFTGCTSMLRMNGKLSLFFPNATSFIESK